VALVLAVFQAQAARAMTDRLTPLDALPPKEMGVILGIAVLLDTALVRLLLVPVILRLLGRHAWYLPPWVDRVLPDVRFGHA
jgi:uncharacterized membrane protein YdfJ with MMPL/SSD domain